MPISRGSNALVLDVAVPPSTVHIRSQLYPHPLRPSSTLYILPWGFLSIPQQGSVFSIPWSTGPIDSRQRQGRTILWNITQEEICSPHGGQEARREMLKTETRPLQPCSDSLPPCKPQPLLFPPVPQRASASGDRIRWPWWPDTEGGKDEEIKDQDLHHLPEEPFVKGPELN